MDPMGAFAHLNSDDVMMSLLETKGASATYRSHAPGAARKRLVRRHDRQQTNVICLGCGAETAYTAPLTQAAMRPREGKQGT